MESIDMPTHVIAMAGHFRVHRARVLAAALALCSAIVAQGNTWIVDQANGPGTHFTDLPTAVASVADGDTLRIRAGTYQSFATAKALTLLGEGVVGISPLLVTPSPPTIEVAALPSGRSFVLKNISVLAFAAPALRLANNAGRVHVESVVLIAVTSQGPSLAVGCSISACREVTFVGGSAVGFPALTAANSAIVMTGMRADGGDWCGSARCTAIGSGVVLSDCVAWLAHTAVTGGDGSPINPFVPPQPAIRSFNTWLFVTGDAATAITAGAGVTAVAGIDTNGGTVERDTQIRVAGNQGAPDIGGSATVVRRRIPALGGRGAPPGGMLDATLVSPAGDPFVVVASVPIDPLVLPPGTVFVDPALLLPLRYGVQGSTERTALTVAVPDVAGLRGGVIALQAASLHQSTQGLEFTNPAIVVLH